MSLVHFPGYRADFPARVRACALLCAGLLFACAATAPPAAAAGADAVCDAYWEQEFEQALNLAEGIIQSAEAKAEEKVEAYKCQTCANVSLRRVQAAVRSIAGMLQLDPGARFSPDHVYPPPVIELYNAVRDSLFPGTMDIRTVAVGDFEDNSPFRGKYKNHDFSKFRGALVHTIMADLAEATPLKIVDRQRTSELLKEVQLGQSGFVSPQDAVRFGQMLGAQSFIFGQYMVLDQDEVRIDARVVHTATGEVVLARQVTGNFGGDPKKFLALERELVTVLAEGLSRITAGGGEDLELDRMSADYFDRKGKGIKERKAYVESKFMIAEALDLEDQAEFDQALKIWADVLRIDPANDVARQRTRALEALAQM